MKDSRREKVGDGRERLKARPTKQEKRQSRGGNKRGRREQQSVVAALNYGAGASFIRIPSPRCSLSGVLRRRTHNQAFH